jgi:ribonuclease Y
MEVIYYLLLLAVGLVVGWVAGSQIAAKKAKGEQVDLEKIRAEADAILAQAKNEADTLRERTAQAETVAIAEAERKAEKEFSRRRSEIDRTESRLRKREEQLEKTEEKLQKKLDSATARDEQAESRLLDIEEDRKALEELRITMVQKAEAISGMTAEQARKSLLENLEDEVRQESAAIVRRVEEETKETIREEGSSDHHARGATPRE